VAETQTPSGPSRPGQQLDQEKLVAVAVSLGPDRLTLREVADTLGVPRTSVYNHVRSPQALGQLVLSSILDRFEAHPFQPSRSPSWVAQLEAFADRTRAELLAAGPWLRFFNPELHWRRGTLRRADQLLKVMVEAGFSAQAAGRALSLIIAVIQESVMRGPRLRRARAEFDHYLHQLDHGEFPWLAAAHSSADYEGEEQYQFNLSCTLTGIQALLK
jgi:AcrR family transcriptional regulator